MKPQKSHILLALWLYLNQPLFNSKSRVVLNPLKFFLPYQIRLLESCWAKDYEIEKRRQLLERCWSAVGAQSTE